MTATLIALATGIALMAAAIALVAVLSGINDPNHEGSNDE